MFYSMRVSPLQRSRSFLSLFSLSKFRVSKCMFRVSKETGVSSFECVLLFRIPNVLVSSHSLCTHTTLIQRVKEEYASIARLALRVHRARRRPARRRPGLRRGSRERVRGEETRGASSQKRDDHLYKSGTTVFDRSERTDDANAVREIIIVIVVVVIASSFLRRTRFARRCFLSRGCILSLSLSLLQTKHARFLLVDLGAGRRSHNSRDRPLNAERTECGGPREEKTTTTNNKMKTVSKCSPLFVSLSPFCLHRAMKQQQNAVRHRHFRPGD